jgi:hypothetical protein
MAVTAPTITTFVIMPEIQRTLPLDPGRDLLRLDFWRSSPRERPLSARCDDGPSRIAFDRVGTSGGVPCDCGNSQHATHRFNHQRTAHPRAR